MGSSLYVLVILYNLNLLLNTYVKIMVKIITIFNYKNTSQFNNNNFYFYDIMVYNLFRNKQIINALIAVN